MSFNPIVYRTDDLSKWGLGQGSDLSNVQIDNNFWNCDDRLQALEASALGKTIEYIAESNGALFVHYSDHTIDGPFPIPSAGFNWRGQWLPSTLYAINDIVTYLGGVYLAVLGFTSGLTFSTNDGSGHTWLQLMFNIPPIPVATVSGSTYTLGITDSNTYTRFTSASGCVVSLPPFSSVPWVPFTEIHLRDETGLTSGGVTVVPLSPAVINGVNGRLDQTETNGATLFLKNVATDSWDIGGLQLFT